MAPISFWTALIEDPICVASYWVFPAALGEWLGIMMMMMLLLLRMKREVGEVETERNQERTVILEQFNHPIHKPNIRMPQLLRLADFVWVTPSLLDEILYIEHLRIPPLLCSKIIAGRSGGVQVSVGS
jgi:hypothetical protein